MKCPYYRGCPYTRGGLNERFHCTYPNGEASFTQLHKGPDQGGLHKGPDYRGLHKVQIRES